jgi:hypothetical protein
MTKVHNRNIKDSISQAANGFLKNYSTFILCTVESVDETNCLCSCTPISGPAITGLENVLLQAEANDGLLLIPTVGSTVMVGTSATDSPFVAMFEDIDKVKLKIGDSTLEVTDGLFKFNGGSNDGMVLINHLITKLNNLENGYNDLVTKYNAHTHILTLSTGTGTAATTVSLETTTLTPTVKADIENTKITQ